MATSDSGNEVKDVDHTAKLVYEEGNGHTAHFLFLFSIFSSYIHYHSVHFSSFYILHFIDTDLKAQESNLMLAQIKKF